MGLMALVAGEHVWPLVFSDINSSLHIRIINLV